MMKNHSDRLTAEQVLRRYEEEELPAFVGMHLTDVNQVGLFGDRPLHVACDRGDMEEIEALVNAGADVNAPGDLGNTPLHEAVYLQHPKVVEFLLEHGASRTAKNDFGETPGDIAKSRGQTDIAKLLLS